jgi:Tfp pilus assembly protein PilO
MTSSLTKTQRDRIIGIVVGTLVIVAALWFLLVQSLNATLAERQKKIAAAQANMDRAASLIRRSGQIQEELDGKTIKLREFEENMASGDLYSWVILTLNKFKVPYKVAIPSYSPAQLGEVGILPDFPYSAATYAISGTGLYHDIGRFVADFENNHPHLRVQNLELRPATGIGTEEPERLEFKMEIVALVKTGGGR